MSDDVVHLASGPSAVSGTGDAMVVVKQTTVAISQLNHHFGEGELRNPVLFDVSLELMPGEIVIMTGPSGSGKTTLLTLIGALRTVQEGMVNVLGRDLKGLSQRELVEVRRGIGFIFQGHNLFDALSARQNVMLAAGVSNDASDQLQKRPAQLLARLGLADRMNYKPGALSGGQRQRVAIARALVNRPRLILADEPTAALDKESGRNVVRMLQEYAFEEKCTILIVTHDNRILDVADRIVNMVDGRIISDVVVAESAEICECLMKCDMFADLPASILSAVADKMSRESHRAGAEIIRQGEVGDKFYLVNEGTLDVLIDGPDGRKRVNRMAKGDFFGEVALLTGNPRTATVVAREDVKLYTLGKSDFDSILTTSGTLQERLRKALFLRV